MSGGSISGKRPLMTIWTMCALSGPLWRMSTSIDLSTMCTRWLIGLTVGLHKLICCGCRLMTMATSCRLRVTIGPKHIATIRTTPTTRTGHLASCKFSSQIMWLASHASGFQVQATRLTTLYGLGKRSRLWRLEAWLMSGWGCSMLQKWFTQICFHAGASPPMIM